MDIRNRSNETSIKTRNEEELPAGDDTELFTRKMRRATKQEHSLSDALINAKLAIAFGSDRVWADGLLTFYEVFKQLEHTMDNHPQSLLASLDAPGLRRTHLFEQDISYYLGKDWKKTYSPRESVLKYVAYLQDLEATQPVLLLAFAYHLYMGLLSGGQILRRKRALTFKFKFNRNETYEGLTALGLTETTVYKMKKHFVDKMNNIAEQELTEHEKQLLIEESKIVFKMNDEVVRSIEGTTFVMIKTLTKYSIITLATGCCLYLFKRLIW